MRQGQVSEPKPTVNDIARVAEVSLATVDRVLNARPGVREITVKKVQRAIADLGYVRDTAAANLARGRVYEFVFILPSNRNEFLSLLEAQIEALNKNLHHERTRVSFVRVAAFDPVALASAIGSIDKNRVDGVAIFGPETPRCGIRWHTLRPMASASYRWWPISQVRDATSISGLTMLPLAGRRPNCWAGS